MAAEHLGQSSGLAGFICVLQIEIMSDTISRKPIRFTRGFRKHWIGRESAYHVIAMTAANITTDPDTGETALSWIGEDERGRQLEIVAIEKPDCFLVIHVVPHHRKEDR
jgi:hypothetical protein